MSAGSPIRVLVADDHTMVRQGLAVFLKLADDLELAGEAENGAEAIDRCAELRPDVVLMDMMMPEMDGAAATSVIKERFPEIQIIALTTFTEEGLVQRALRAGAIGYL